MMTADWVGVRVPTVALTVPAVPFAGADMVPTVVLAGGKSCVVSGANSGGVDCSHGRSGWRGDFHEHHHALSWCQSERGRSGDRLVSSVQRSVTVSVLVKDRCPTGKIVRGNRVGKGNGFAHVTVVREVVGVDHRTA